MESLGHVERRVSIVPDGRGKDVVLRTCLSCVGAVISRNGKRNLRFRYMGEERISFKMLGCFAADLRCYPENWIVAIWRVGIHNLLN